MEDHVSVVIPFHPEITPPEMLDEAIECVEAQSVPTEIIIIKDTDSGPAEARNKGIEKASHRYVAFFDADDLWVENKLKRQLKQIKENCVGVCIESSDVAPPGVINPDKLIKNILQDRITGFTSSLFIDCKQIETRFDTDMKRYEDHLFLAEAAAEAGVCTCPNLITVRKHDNGLTAQNTSELILESRKKFYQRLQDRVPEAKPFLPACKRSIWYVASKVARQERKYVTAFWYLLISLRYGVDQQNTREIVLFPYYITRYIISKIVMGW